MDPSEQFDFYQEKFGYDFFNKVPTTISPTQDLPVPNDYKLSLSDEMQIILSGNKNITYSLEVNLDGSILLPEIGSVYVAGQSFGEVKNILINIFKQSYVGVNIDVSLKSLSAKKITIVGAVEVPGTYLVNPYSTISNAIAYAGGVKEYGSLRNIILKRPNGDELFFDLYELLISGDRTNDLSVGAGDTIIVGGTSNFFEIKGAIIRPFIYEYKQSDSYQDLLILLLVLVPMQKKIILQLL